MEMPRVARLANDIAAQFPHQGDAQAAQAVAAHMRQFWEPRMRAELVGMLSLPDPGLTARARAAAELLTR